MIKLLGVLALLVPVLGCVTAKPTIMSLPRERAQDCVEACDLLGMRMSAVVVVMNSVGCVCEPQGTTGMSTNGAAAVTAAASVHYQQEQQQRTYASQPH